MRQVQPLPLHRAPARRRRRRRPWWRRRRRLVALGLAALVLALLVAVFAAWNAIALRRDLLRAQTELDLAVAITDPVLQDFGSFNETEAALRESAAHLTAADDALASAERRAALLAPAFWAAGVLPGWPGGLREVRPLIGAARDLGRAGTDLADAFSAMTARLEAGSGEPAGARMVAGLNEAEAGFRRALERLEQGKAARDRVDAGDLRGPLAPAATALVKFDLRYQPLHDNALLLAQLPEAARQVLGMEGARTYAVLGQNSAELRPTGGFIGSMGLITLENGALTREDYRSSYSFDNYERGFEPLPPAMATHIGFGGWAVRDANWSPDFPTTARKVEDLLGWHQGIAVDGVFGFTTYTVGALLDALGPLNVPGFPEPLTSAGWYALAEQLIYRDPTLRTIDDLHQNKGEVLGPVLQAIVGRMQNAGADELPRLLRTLQALVQQRQLLIAFHDPAPATMAALYQADGRFAPPDDGDVLALNDANLSYSKVGPYIDERIEYDVWLDARGVAQRSRVTVTYSNRVTAREAVDPVKRIGGLEFDAATETVRPNPGVYGTYARLYLPAGSELLEASDGPSGLFSASDLGFTTLERYYSVPAASQRGFSYTYRIPAERALDGAYRLRVLKQPGTPGHALEVRVHLPEGVAAAPSLPMTREGDALVYRGQLITPLALELQIGERSP